MNHNQNFKWSVKKLEIKRNQPSTESMKNVFLRLCSICLCSQFVLNLWICWLFSKIHVIIKTSSWLNQTSYCGHLCLMKWLEGGVISVTWPVKWNKLRFSSMEGTKPHFTKLNCIFKIKFQRRIQFHLLLKVRCFVKCWLGSNTWGLFPFRKFPPIGHSTNQTPWSPLVLLFVTQKC